MIALFAVVFVTFVASCASAPVLSQEPLHLPSYIGVCQRDSPDVNQCILKALRNAHPYLVKGIQSLNLPPLDPFKLEETLLEYHNGQIHAKFGIRNCSFYGLRELQYKDVRTDFSDLDNLKINVDIYIPKISSDGRYKMQGQFIKSEFGGKGQFNVTMNNIRATWLISGSKIEENGVTYMKINHMDMEPVIGDMKVFASNLFGGNEALSKTALKLFNQNWRLVYKELLPYVRKDWDRIMTEIANRVFMKVPFKEIFPPSS